MTEPKLNAAVLVVDDNVDLAKGLVRMLAFKKISAHCVYSGSAALAWLGTSKPGLVILDITMPDMSGIEVLAQIRANPELTDLPVVLHSALDNEQVMSLASTCGANGVLLKGRYTIADVLTVVGMHTVPAKPDA